MWYDELKAVSYYTEKDLERESDPTSGSVAAGRVPCRIGTRPAARSWPMPILQFKGKTAVENYHYTMPHQFLEFDK